MKSAVSPARRVGKILYRVAVALSAVIVVLYGVYRYLARPPELTGPAPAAGIQPTDDPDTEVDERLAAVTPAPEPAMAITASGPAVMLTLPAPACSNASRSAGTASL